MDNHLIPLFWQHHEPEDVLREEIDRMNEAGIGSFIVEARPHPEYLQDGWWQDLHIIIDQAKKRDMRVWIFDDSAYPSGVADGIIERDYPHYCKRYLAQRHIDAMGPLPDASFLIKHFIGKEEELVAVISAERTDGEDALNPDSLTDITEFVRNGILYWDVPQGDHRIFVLVKTRDGGEAHTRSYVNPLSKEAVRCFIDLIYEAHAQKIGNEFGKTVAGFFTDEPRFGNDASYQSSVGTPKAVLPWSDDLLEELSRHPQGLGSFRKYLPLLWYPADTVEADVRYVYMDVVSRRFSQCFIGQMGDWCADHGVELIGHFVEENGAHARLGYGPGHFFRASSGLHMAGIDVVCNIYPGRRSGKFLTAFNYFDADFNHWGLSKLASSEAALNPTKKGRAFCEAFGAYGWSEGLKTMKWITDAICVRGINAITPHAFSPHEYPDTDCPPHFYARGKNPQWAYFPLWAGYANRVCDRLNGGQAVASVAVLYHAEAEWGGLYQPFEKVVKALMTKMIDSTVVSADYLCAENAQVSNGELNISGNRFSMLIVPESQYIPPALYRQLVNFRALGLPVVFCNSYPDRCYGGEPFAQNGFAISSTEGLAEHVKASIAADVELLGEAPGLVYRHYCKQNEHSYFFTNEELHSTVDAYVAIAHQGPVYFYDPMKNRCYEAEEKMIDGKRGIRLVLSPYQSIFLVCGNMVASDVDESRLQAGAAVSTLQDGWQISLCPYDKVDTFDVIKENASLFSISHPDAYPEFSGTIHYERAFDWAEQTDAILDLGRVYECASVTVNGRLIAQWICPPYKAIIPKDILKKEGNRLVIEVVNTLVKANSKNPFDRHWPQEPSGLLGPVVIGSFQA